MRTSSFEFSPIHENKVREYTSAEGIDLFCCKKTNKKAPNFLKLVI
jgi:hypothetical protein